MKNNKKPYFSDKGSNSNQVTLLENKPLLTDDKDIVKTMNNFFINITKNLNLKPYKDYSLTDIIEISSNFDNHISKKKIKQSFPNITSGDFNFQGVSMEEVKKKKKKLNVKKPSTNGSIPATILKQLVEYIYGF